MLQFVGSNHHPTALAQIDFDTSAICQGLDFDTASRVAPLVSIRNYAAKQAIFYELDPAKYVYEVVTGVLTLYKQLPDGRRQITGFLYPGHYLGLTVHGHHVHSAEALTDVTVCRYPRCKIEKLVGELPALAMRLLTLTGNELAMAQEQMLLLGRKTATEKIASFLLTMSEQNGKRGDDKTSLYLPMSRVDIGDYLGLTIETVSRIFTRLRKAGVIALGQPNVVAVNDIGRLARLADGDDTLFCN